MWFLPYVEGSLPIRTSGPAFLDRFRRRVEAGLLTGHPHPRARYVVTQSDAAEMHVRAVNALTAFNVGLNEVDLDVTSPGTVRYRIWYWRWAGYAIGLSALLGAVGLTLLLAFDARAYIASNMDRMVPGLTVDQNLWIAWGMVAFWGFVWPWLLVAMHKRPLHGLVERIVSEVDAGGAGGDAR